MPEKRTRVWDMPSRQVRVWHNRIWSFLTKHHLNVVTVGLLLCSLFFFLKIQPVRNRALSNNPEWFTDGQMVTITKVIDGDELRIENDQGSTRLRLLGIMSFDASANDMVVSGFARDCVAYLESAYKGKQAKLRIASKRIDGEGRLLGNLYVGENEIDLAMELVKNGLTLVFLRYSFDGMDQYRQAQSAAQDGKRGLWANEGVAHRAESMLRLWEQERRDEEQP